MAEILENAFNRYYYTSGLFGTVKSCQKMIDKLKEIGISCRVMSMPTVKPHDESAIKDAATTKLILTVEEHFLKGGLFGAVAEFLVMNNIGTRCIPVAVPDEFPKGVGSQEYFLERYGITTDNMVNLIMSELKKEV